MIETPFIYQAKSMGSSAVCPAFAQGCGGKIVLDKALQPGPIMVFGHPDLWPLLKQAKSEGRVWYYADHAYFRRRKFFRITRNAFQYEGPGEEAPDRLRGMRVQIEPWQKGGRHILVCPPDPLYCARQGFNAAEWQRNIIAELKRHTDRPIHVRQRIGCERAAKTLQQALDGAHAMVTHHSNAAVEALCMGYPVFVTGQCAARPMASGPIQNIERPLYPDDRELWAGALANNQWSINEIASGAAWGRLTR